MMNTETTVQLNAENPWLGLLPFSEAAQDFFHGRDEETAQLLRLVRRQRLTILYGRSGLGKTSLLNAGLFPVLRQEQFLPVYVRIPVQTGAWQPLEYLHEVLAERFRGAGVDVRPIGAGESLWEYSHRNEIEFWDERNRLLVPVLVFDQFEEVLAVAEERPLLRPFLKELTDLVTNRVPVTLKSALEEQPEQASLFDFTRISCKVILSFREDYLATFDDVCRRISSVSEERMRLLPMTGRQALDAILLTGKALVSNPAAEQIIAFVAGRRAETDDVTVDLSRLEVDPALLSLVCRELNNQRIATGRKRITQNLLAGARDEIIADFYRRALADVGEGMRLFIEEQLLTSAGFRDSRALADALAQPGVTREAIDRLIERRLLRLEERLGTLRIELAHDVLTPVIRQQRDLRRESQAAQVRAEAAEAAARHERAQREEQERLAREADERALKARRDARRAQMFTGAMAVLLLIACGAVFFAWRAQETADQQKRIAENHLKLALDAAKHNVGIVSDNVSAGRLTVAVAREALKVSQKLLETIGPENANAEVIQAQFDLYDALADIYDKLDLAGDTLEAGKRQWDLAERLSSMPVESVTVRIDKIDAALNIIAGYAGEGDVTHAREEGKVALELLQKPETGTTQAEPDRMRAPGVHLALANIDTIRHSATGALELLRRAEQSYAAASNLDSLALAEIHRWRARNLAAQGHSDAALTELRQADTIIGGLLKEEPTHTARLLQEAWIDLEFADLFRRQGDQRQARQRLDAASELIASGLDLDSDRMDWAELAVDYYDHQGGLARLQSAWDECLSDHQKFLEDLRKQAAGPSIPYYAWPELLAREQLGIAEVRLARGELTEALQSYQDAEKTASDFSQRQPSFPPFQVHLAAAKFGIGDVRRAQGDNKSAWEAYQAGFAIMQPIVEASPDDAIWQHDFAMAKARGAAIRRALGDTTGADADLAFAVASLTGLAKIDPANVEWRDDLASLSHQQQEAGHAGP
jgi:tetratricopeptide (TPR) repeat protein